MISVGIVGGSGYAGLELIRILYDHPETEISVVSSRVDDGNALNEVHRGLGSRRGKLVVSNPDAPEFKKCDVVFFATPHGVAQKKSQELLNNGVRIIDLSPDFRLKDVKDWEHWYGMKHTAPELLSEAVYGLPEINAQKIRSAQLVANPGCYATAIQLGFLPLIASDEIDNTKLIADAKSGISGAGRSANRDNLFGEISENFRAYSVKGHRHHPEILQGLNDFTSEKNSLVFVPHVMPASRGIFATLYATARNRNLNPHAIFEKWYEKSKFVEVLSAGVYPETRHVRGTNNCLISVNNNVLGDQIIVLVVIDNLVKGAAGQAVQNMNIMFGLEEKLGLEKLCLLP